MNQEDKSDVPAHPASLTRISGVFASHFTVAFSMARPALADIAFDEQDANLFLVKDARLRADALKHSILPRLQVVMNEAIMSIRNVLGIEVLSDSIVSVAPNFRTKRTSELEHLYDSALVALGGQRKDKWLGFSRTDGKPVQILPFRLGFVLDRFGISIVLENRWMRRLTRECFNRLLKFHLENEEKINALCFASGMQPAPLVTNSLPFLSTQTDQYRVRLENGWFDNHFFGHTYYYSVLEQQLQRLIAAYTIFFPVYDSYIRIAKALPPRLDELIAKLNAWMQAEIEREDNDIDEKVVIDPHAIHSAAISAEQKIRVMPAMRWQVFQRDRWKCVACGRSSHDDVILHVDHIVPRSLGGHDGIDNYQTLCNLCNIGKSNRDATNLRREG